MPKIDLTTKKIASGTYVDLKEKAAIKSRADSQQDYVKQALADIRMQLVKEDLIRDKWNHQEEIKSRVNVFVQGQELLMGGERAGLIQTILDDLFGIGILEKYRKGHEYTEIIIDGPDRIMVEKGGSLYDVPEKFADADELTLWFDTHIMPMTDGKRHFDEGHPRLDVETRDGERVHASRPPVTQYVTMNMRKAASQTQYFTAADFVRLGSASEEMMDFLINAARGKLTILVLGRTGSGKTTVVRDLVEEGISDDERVLFIEDVRETNARKRRFLSMQTVDRGEGENGNVTMLDLFRDGMRMRPDRICVSEIRGAEAAPFMLTTAVGHPGAISTMHAGDPEKADFLLSVYLKRSEEMNMPMDILKQFIHEQVALYAFVDRELTGPNRGKRRITGIYELNSLLGSKQTEPFTHLFGWNPELETYEKLAELSPEKKQEILRNGGKIA